MKRPRMVCVVALVGAASLAACAQDGQVVERETNRPLEGVVVVKVWRGTVPTVVQTSSMCYHVAYVRSDKDGRFSLPRFSWRPSPVVDSRTFIALAYKTGYHLVETNFEDRIVMERHSDSPSLRFEQILKPTTKLPFDCDEVKALVDPILRPIHAELVPLVQTQSDFERTDDVLGMIETFTIGDDAAHANSLRRRAEWRNKGGTR